MKDAAEIKVSILLIVINFSAFENPNACYEAHRCLESRREISTKYYSEICMVPVEKYAHEIWKMQAIRIWSQKILQRKTSIKKLKLNENFYIHNFKVVEN